MNIHTAESGFNGPLCRCDERLDNVVDFLIAQRGASWHFRVMQAHPKR
ncbi:hypothetical protein ACI2KE_00990 [Pseudomonas monteilii]